MVVGAAVAVQHSSAPTTSPAAGDNELKAAVEHACGSTVRYRLRSEQSMDALRKRGAQSPPSTHRVLTSSRRSGGRWGCKAWRRSSGVFLVKEFSGFNVL